jgi:tRNA A-37 threonylcarbamoyl transferase component Bud32
MYGSFNGSAQEIWEFTRCQRSDGTHYGTGGKCRKGTEAPYADWEPLAKGNYGKVSKSPDGKLVVKELLTGEDGKKGEFGPYERQLAIRMGKLGHSPRIHSVSSEHIEMDLAPGKPLWKSYAPAEGEGPMTAKQALNAAAAVKALHKLGFYHGDAHALQWMVDGDNVKLVDYGLSGKTARRPEKALQDLSKWAKIIGWKNPELAGDPYFELVNRTMEEYNSIKGQSKKAKADRIALAERYLEEAAKL